MKQLTRNAWVMIIAAIFLPMAVMAQTSTWDGASSSTDDWSDADNWGGTALSANDVLEFDGTTRLTPSNDFTANTRFDGINFLSTAGAFTLIGNAINLNGDINNATGSTQTINMDIELLKDIGVHLSAGNSSSQITIGGDISGSHGVTFSGTDAIGNNQINLGGSNTYSGGTTVGTDGNRVTVRITEQDSLPGEVTVVGNPNDTYGSTLRLAGDTTFTNNISISGNGARSLNSATWVARQGAGALVLNNGAEVTGTVTLTGNSRISGNPRSSGTISGKITGNYALQFGFVQEQPGTITITNPNNDWTGDTLVTGGSHSSSSGRKFRLELGAAHVLPSGPGFGDVTIANNNNTTLDTNGHNQNINGLNGGAVLEGGGVFTLGNGDADGDYNGRMTVDSLVKVGSGTQSIGWATTTTTGTIVSNGTLKVDAGYLTGGPITVENIANLVLDGGNAELRYSSATDYSGPFTFTSGTLKGTNWNGGLSGLTIGSGHTINPGMSPGKATTESQTWAPGGTFAVEINNPDGTAGVNWNLLEVTGELDISALSAANQFVIKPISLTPDNSAGLLEGFDKDAQYQWEIVTFGTISGDFSSALFSIDDSAFDNETAGYGFEMAMENNTLYLNYNVPPPTGTVIIIN